MVLGAHLAAFLAIRSSQTRYTDEASDIAEWAEAEGVSRIAWPDELRAAVPTLREAGITPVLYDPPELNAQQLVLNDTPIVVTRDSSDPFADISTDEHSAGSLDAQLVDLEATSTVPLDTGQSIEMEYSRPYLYAPILDSHRLEVGEPLQVPATLAAGTYVLTTEAFDHDVRLALTLSARPHDGTPVAQQYELAPVVFEPQIFGFGVEDLDAGPFTIQMEVTPVAGAPEGGDTPTSAFLHRWSLERTA